MSIVHVHLEQNIISKTIYHAVNVTITEAELFVIKCGINQVVQVQGTDHIIVIINTIHSVKCIFDSLSHPYQIQFITNTQDHRSFFKKNNHNSIIFWECPNKAK